MAETGKTKIDAKIGSGIAGVVAIVASLLFLPWIGANEEGLSMDFSFGDLRDLFSIAGMGGETPGGFGYKFLDWGYLASYALVIGVAYVIYKARGAASTLGAPILGGGIAAAAFLGFWHYSLVQDFQDELDGGGSIKYGAWVGIAGYLLVAISLGLVMTSKKQTSSAS